MAKGEEENICRMHTRACLRGSGDISEQVIELRRINSTDKLFYKVEDDVCVGGSF
jgi:hypothetical protein